MTDRYRVLIPSGIEYPTDPAILRKLRHGERIGYPQRRNKRAECGEIVDDIPRESVPVLIKKGWIETVRGASRP